MSCSPHWSPFPASFRVSVSHHAHQRMYERFPVRKREAVAMVKLLVRTGGLVRSASLGPLFRNARLNPARGMYVYSPIVKGLFVVRFYPAACRVITVVRARLRPEYKTEFDPLVPYAEQFDG